MIRLAILLIRPLEAYHSWVWRRAYTKGKYLRPGTEKACVTTRKASIEEWLADETVEASDLGRGIAGL